MGYRDLAASDADGDLEALREEVHEFAREEIRPAAREIDDMGAERYARIADRDSPYWDVMAGLKERGYHRAVFPEAFGGDGLSGAEYHVLMEELAWGSPGFAMAYGVDLIPAIFAAMPLGNDLDEQFLEPYLADEEARFQGAWGVTEPLRGSELLMPETTMHDEVPAGEREAYAEPQATAERDGDEWVIDGVKASWASAGPMATHVALHVNVDPAGGDPGALCVVPMDADGASTGEPIRKLGQRDCPQGELRFENVRIPEENVIMTPEMLHPETGLASMDQILCLTSAGMSAAATGLARAAFEEALAYARDREQSGKPIAKHQSVKSTLYEMFEKVETARSYSRRATEHVWERTLESFQFDASLHHALAAQVYCKRIAFEVAHDAVQLHGANGITREYHVEKLFRDARVKMIEDGTTEVLGLEAAEGVLRNYEVG